MKVVIVLHPDESRRVSSFAQRMRIAGWASLKRA